MFMSDSFPDGNQSEKPSRVKGQIFCDYMRISIPIKVQTPSQLALSVHYAPLLQKFVIIQLQFIGAIHRMQHKSVYLFIYFHFY